MRTQLIWLRAHRYEFSKGRGSSIVVISTERTYYVLYLLLAATYRSEYYCCYHWQLRILLASNYIILYICSSSTCKAQVRTQVEVSPASASTIRMELRNIDRIAPLTGHVLNAEEVVGLENAMLMTKLNEQLNNDLKFWGKVFGKANDYLVVQYVNKYAKFPAFPSKKYYFCTTADFTLRALDSIAEKKEHKAKAAELLGHFEGDPGFYKYSEEVEEDEVDPATEDEEGNPLPPKQDNKFREVHRLAYIVEVH